MNYYLSGFPCSDELYHHGILGQKWGVRRFQNPDGTLTAEGRVRYSGVSENTDTGGYAGTSRAHYKVSGSTGSSLGTKIRNAVDSKMEKRREKLIRSRPWLMTDEELKKHLDRINMEKSYVNALNEVNQNSRSKRFKRLIDDIVADGAKTMASAAMEAAANRVIAKDDLKSEIKRSKKLSEQYAKNKVNSDILIDKGLRKYDKKLASSKILKSVEKNYQSMDNDEVEYARKKWENLKALENRYRGSTLQSYSSKGGNNNQNNNQNNQQNQQPKKKPKKPNGGN